MNKNYINFGKEVGYYLSKLQIKNNSIITLQNNKILLDICREINNEKEWIDSIFVYTKYNKLLDVLHIQCLLYNNKKFECSNIFSDKYYSKNKVEFLLKDISKLIEDEAYNVDQEKKLKGNI